MKHQVIDVLVIIYDKKLEDSKTLQTLTNNTFLDFNLTIVNNGPNLIKDDEPFFIDISRRVRGTKLINRVENAPLSKLYNEFILNNKNSDYYIIFDDDSDVSPDFMHIVSLQEADILLPRIYSVDDNQYYYPIQDGVIINESTKVDPGTIMSISSGLVLKKKLVDYFNIIYNGGIFDERFALYGIDTSFFLRLHKLSNRNKIHAACISTIKHSLSRVSSVKSEFRTLERLYDAAITARHYPHFLTKRKFAHIILYYIYKLQFKYVFVLLLYFIKGKHPRVQ
ncbi:glycosyltransferase [Klebsiella variicola]|uniref:glycosyltransferase family 2 protein n=1 Tax=Klebsiella variicola TaxID=244366 RepID=UPI001254426D|nr:glycosyl transferase [Klebsiella variicola]HBQ3164907.1 glycosyl transferase [Klebsiella variicola subsp. variicola]HBT4840815.1 glycosyl transferase [Klebsiella quasipneumoniae subsp. similipneumoniae]MBR8846418.1 hypothetical protein [Klebsiella variicola]MBY5169733.1 glycosyl transferase [Klebsiella variicola]MCR3915922.1 glycosyl transferase [Klebsiella variicola]